MSRRKPPRPSEQELAEQRERAAAWIRLAIAGRRNPKIRAARIACDRATFSPEYRLARLVIGDD